MHNEFGKNKHAQRLKNLVICTTTLKTFANVMYNIVCPDGLDMDMWTQQQLERLMASKHVNSNKLWIYMKEKWFPRTLMWVMGHINLLYAR